MARRNLLYLVGTAAIVLFLILLVTKPKKEKENVLRDYSQIQNEGVMHIATRYEPGNYYVDGDSIGGLQYELIRLISEQVKDIEVIVRMENNLETAINGLLNNQYDIIAQPIPITNEYKEVIAFTEPIASDKQVLVQRIPGSDDTLLIRNQIELAHKTVHVPQYSPAIVRLNNLSEEIAEPILIAEDSIYTSEQLIYRVAFGEIDYAVVDRRLAEKLQPDFPQLDVKTDISFTQLHAWAVRKESVVLLDSLNRWLGQ